MFTLRTFAKIFAAAVCIIAIGAGFFLYSKRNALMQDALNFAADFASKNLGTTVTVGSANLDNISLTSFKTSELVLRDIKIFDKNSEPIAAVDEARLTFKLLALYYEGAAAIDTVTVNGARANIVKRADKSWNFNDIKPKSSGGSNFDAFVTINDANVHAEFDGKSVDVENISATADCADLDAIKTKITATTLGSNVDAAATLGLNRQIVNARVDFVDLTKILPFIPAELIPEGVEFIAGNASSVALNIFRRFDSLSFSGEAIFADAQLNVLDTNISDLNGSATFTDSQIFFDAAARANDQPAAFHGSVRSDAVAPFFDIFAASNSFRPSAVVPNLGVSGAVAFSAHLTGTFDDPTVTADISAPALAYQNISAANISAILEYQRNAVQISEIRADSFGGSVSGDCSFNAISRAFNAHVNASAVDSARLCAFANLNAPVSGSLNANFNVSGNVDDFQSVTAFGAFDSPALFLQNFPAVSAKASFAFVNQKISLDYLKFTLPDRGRISLAGTITDFNSLDLNFRVNHLNLALAKNISTLVDLGGLADANGTLSGNISNPALKLNLDAVDDTPRGFRGIIVNQPFDSATLAASGNLDRINVDKFELEKDGKITWTVIDGTVGLTGDKNINLRLDTIGARTEDIIKVFAPDRKSVV